MTLHIDCLPGIVARKPQEVRDKIKDDSLLYKGEPLSAGHKGAITGHLNKWLGSNDNRYLVLAWLFSTNANFEPVSSKQLEEGDWFALSEWVNAEQDEYGHWEVGDLFPIESALVLRAALKDYYSIKFSDRTDEKIQRSIIDSMVDAAVVDLDGYIAIIHDEGEEIPEERVLVEPDKPQRLSRYSDMTDYDVNF